MPKLYYGHVMSGDVKIHYYRTGDEKPPVVLLHGITDNGLCWNQMALHLEPEYDVVMVDARGHGLSDAPGGGYTAGEMAEDAVALIRQLALDRPVVIGHSIGAEMAAVIAARYPQLVSGVVLEDPPWYEPGFLPSESERRQRAEDLRQSILEMQAKGLEELLATARQKYPNGDGGDHFHWARAKQQARPEVAQKFLEAPRPWMELIQQFGCPVLLVTGDPALGALVTAEVAAQVERTWKNGKVVHLPGAGHSIHRTQFEPFYRAVLDFLKQRNWKAKKG